MDVSSAQQPHARQYTTRRIYKSLQFYILLRVAILYPPSKYNYVPYLACLQKNRVHTHNQTRHAMVQCLHSCVKVRIFIFLPLLLPHSFSFFLRAGWSRRTILYCGVLRTSTVPHRIQVCAFPRSQSKLILVFNRPTN